MKVGVLGAGCIGQFVGAHLHAAGIELVFVGRTVLQRTKRAGVLRCTDLERPAFELTLPCDQLHLAFEPDALADCDVVFVCLKCGDTANAHPLQSLRPDAVIVSLQNGTENAAKLRKLCSQHVVAGMVPYGVNELAPGHFHRGTYGALVFEESFPSELCSALQGQGLSVELVERSVMPAVQWFKLVINLGNALNALVGLPLLECLANGEYREMLCRTWSEGLMACAAAQIEIPSSVSKLNGKPIDLVMFAMRLPDSVYKIITARLKTTDANYRSSMWTDLDQKRVTEIEEINGAIVSLGARHGVATPMNALLMRLVLLEQAKRQGSPKMSTRVLYELARRECPQLGARRYDRLLMVVAIALAAGVWYARN